MTDFLEINEKEKAIKRLNLEDLSIDNLKPSWQELFKRKFKS